MPTVVLLFAAAFIAGLVLLVLKKAEIAGRILMTLSVAGLGVFIWMIAIFLVAFSDVHASFDGVIVTVSLIILVAWAICAIWKAGTKKYIYIPALSVLAVCIVSALAFHGYQHKLDSIPTVGEGDNLLLDYSPYYENTKAVQLGEEAELSISENFPVMDGATALYPIYSSFAKAIYPREVLDEANYNSAVYEQCLNCSTTAYAYENIVTGDADIIFAAAPSEEQKKFSEENGVELVYTPIGKEAFVFFVNSQNPFEDITIDEIQKIYSGEIKDWDELGVKGLGKIKAFQREEGSGSQSALIRLMGDKELAEAPEEDVVSGMGGIIRKAADYKNFKNSIGYSFRFYSTQMVNNNQIKLLKINGNAPTLENIENGTYPIASYFYAVTRADADENTKKVLNWVCGRQGQKIVELTGYTPVNK